MIVSACPRCRRYTRSSIRKQSLSFLPPINLEPSDWCLVIVSAFSVVLAYFIDSRDLEICKKCAGQGGSVCFVCNGTGKIKTEDRGITKCTGCFGRGKILCTKCKGSGYSKMWF
eukprot:jgi/Galph1/5507/GphlegSOOS_G4197.1